jgi:hypothetical protein
MFRTIGVFAAAFVFAVALDGLAQQCDVANGVDMTCDSSVAVGSSAQCTLSIKNVGQADCVGNWTTTLGAFDLGTVGSIQGSPLFSSCTSIGDVTLPTPIFNQTVVHSATVCQGSGTLSPGATVTMTGRITPAATFTGSTFIAAYLMTFRRTGTIPGTQQLTSYGGVSIAVSNCTATPNVAGATVSGSPYVVSWNSTSTTAGYEIQEATKPDFSDAITTSTPSTSKTFQHTVTAATTFYYRVRPVVCGGSQGTFGSSTQIVVVPQQPPTSRDFDLVVPLGSTAQVSQDITFTGLTPNAPFTVTTDKPYLTVTPATGTTRSDGSATVTVRGNPSNLGVGANTGTIVITVGSGKGTPSPNDGTTGSKTVSISLVTPVVGNPKGAPPPDALIVPAVAHLEGLASFRSDIRITNAGSTTATYLLSFTPSNSDGTTTGRQTTISVDPGQTVALNDVLKDFFGFAQPADSAGGVLDIRVLAGSAATTFVSSRTYAATANGTYGQFIPAVPVAKFLKAGGGALTLTQVSQSDAFRTNIGILEGLGVGANGRFRVFGPSGESLGEVPWSLRPFEFQQLGSFLSTKLGISAPDARVEVVVDSPAGSVTTYASVLDNKTQDPLAVSPVQTSSLTANRYILPGMSDFASQFSNFHSDIRIFNASGGFVNATATFYPQGNGTPVVRSVGIAPNEIKAYNNVLPTLFGATGTGGSIVVTTPTNTPLIVSGRTYSNDAASGGTFGQFIPAVTPADGVGFGDGPLQVLQLEQSANFRSNLGLNELTGNPVTLHIAAIIPDSKTSPGTDVTLAPNEFRQLGSVLASLNAGNTYNARITVQVTSGSGRVAAYGSVVDNLTTDPTYVPSQK